LVLLLDELDDNLVVFRLIMTYTLKPIGNSELGYKQLHRASVVHDV